MIELRKNSPEQLDIRKMLREPYFVPETKEADELFRTMQAERRHMAILVDEYGGFSGIVTIEDLVEEIMGDINEEYEEVVPEIEAVSEDEYRLDGGILIDDVNENEELGLKLETENYDTLSGFLIEKLGHIPAKDDRDVVEEDNLIFTVEEVKDNRISRVNLKIMPREETEEKDEEKVKGDAVSMKKLSIEEELRNNSYPGRGIIIGKTPDGKKAVTAYFIMGRSGNSRNRIFVEDGEGIRTQAFDPSKLEDPSLIIYAPVRVLGNKTIVTNGDQTDTIYEGMDKQLTFEQSLRTREFEPDGPNYTPRISGIMHIENGTYNYAMSILKSNNGSPDGCCRYTFAYENPAAGEGHFIHTYMCDGDPLPSFEGEPKLIGVPDDMEAFTELLWNSLNEENKVSLFVRYIDIETGKYETKIVNKNQ